MSFIKRINSLNEFDFESYFSKVSEADIKRSLIKKQLGTDDFLNLISDQALPYIEDMAQRANRLTVQHFGRTISIYTPLYLANYCENECKYCGFKKTNSIKRKKLNLEEIEKEAIKIYQTGVRHILLLTGESRTATPMDYLEEAVLIMKKYFASISIEMFPMKLEEYKRLGRAGVDGLTLYQEVYNKDIYDMVHPSGAKSDYEFRLDAIENGAAAGFRSLNIGSLFGLGEVKAEAFLSALHAKYLDDKYLDVEVSLSLPRLTSACGDFKIIHRLDDNKFVQILLAYRLFLPRVGITISTREEEKFRNCLIKLGVTRFSAGSKTDVGGYSGVDRSSTPQFEISDMRSVSETVEMIRKSGYQPVFKDWERMVD
jgi:2-iminoacetate synthase